MPPPGPFDGSAIAAESEKPTFFTDPEDEYEYANNNFFNRSQKLSKMSGNNEKNIINNPFVQVSNQSSNLDTPPPWLNLNEKKVNQFGPGTNFNNIGTKDPFLVSNSNCSMEKNIHSDARGYNMTNIVNLNKSINNSTSSSTCVSNSDDIKVIKNSSSELVSTTILDSNSNKSEEFYTFQEVCRLEYARRQLKIRSYYKTFKIFSFIAFLLFFPSILTIIMECSCMSSSNFCLPRFEIQTSGPVLTNDNVLDFFGAFKLRKLSNGDNMRVKSKALSMIGLFFKTLSGMVLDSEFDDGLISDGLNKIFETSNRVIYKFSHLGYCKQIEENLEKSTECHSYLGFGIDIPSVLIKDLAYELSFREIEGDPEEVSNIFISNYRELLEKFKDHEYSNNQYFIAGYLSSVMGQIIGCLSFLRFLFDFVALILCIIVSLNLKGKEMENKKDKLAVNDEKREVKNSKSNENNFVYKSLFVSNLLLFFSVTIESGSMIYEVFYLDQFVKHDQWGLIEGIKLISGGTIIDIINIVTHIFVMIGISFVLLTKPWIVKIII